jgi:hypothetical protein
MKKIFRFILRAVLVIIMACYVMVGISSSMALYKLEMNKKEAIGNLSGVIKKAVDENRSNDVTLWVRLRTPAETEAITAIIMPESGMLGPDIFFELSRRQIQEGHMEQALFWSQLGRYRLRYDTLRCGGEDSKKIFDTILTLATSPKINDLLAQHPELVKKSIQQVMDFDAKYPAQNNPSFTCIIFDKVTKSAAPPVPREQWAQIHKKLRDVTEQALKEMNGKHP